MLASLGDLVDDIAVRLLTPINVASDTAAVIERRQGGSAANVAVAAARLTGSARLLTQVGDDVAGRSLLADLSALGVDVSAVRIEGRTGSIVVLLDAAGERTMLTDPGASRSLARPDPAWLDGIDVLHIPYYSLSGGPLADTARTLIGWAHEGAIPVSVDVSSVALIDLVGPANVLADLDALRPAFVFANADEAASLGIDRSVATVATVVKHGGQPAVIYAEGGAAASVPAPTLDDVVDTTGAGDAFAAGLLTSPNRDLDLVLACLDGHRSAAALLASR